MSINNLTSKLQENSAQCELNKKFSKFHFNPFECINYSKFDEMRKKLDNFNLELINSIKENNKIENENVKKGFFTSLHSLLIEISLIKDEKMRIIKIEEVFKWFKKKISSFQNVKINFKSSNRLFEKYSVPESYKKSDFNEEGKIHNILDKNKKTFIENVEYPKEKYNFQFNIFLIRNIKYN